MSDYTIGHLFREGRTTWPEQGRYRFAADRHHQLHLFLSNPSRMETDAVQSGYAQFALLVREHVAFLLFRFGRLPWSDDPFNWHLLPENQQVPLAVGQKLDHGCRVEIVLVDAQCGVVKALRTVVMPLAFSRTLIDAIRDQADRPFQAAATHQQIRQTYVDYPTNENMVRAAQARCIPCGAGR